MIPKTLIATMAGTLLAASAVAAPPQCESIPDDRLRAVCQERVRTCEPLRTAREREECYRGPRSARAASLPAVPAPPAWQAAPLKAPLAIPAPPPPSPPPVPAPSTAPATAEPRPGPADFGKPVVTAFYGALAIADGRGANEWLIPEIRNKGAFEPEGINRFYSDMREPLRLLAVSRLNDKTLRARYAYVHTSGRRCLGDADVTLAWRDERPLIVRIKALDGC
jgi:hypothetical protein